MNPFRDNKKISCCGPTASQEKQIEEKKVIGVKKEDWIDFDSLNGLFMYIFKLFLYITSKNRVKKSGHL